MWVVVEVFIVSAQSEPGSSEAIAGGTFVVSECSARVVGDKGGEGTGGLQEGAESDGLCDVQGHFGGV